VHSDTRTLQPGDLFVALRGERFDAHDFLPQAAPPARPRRWPSAASPTPACRAAGGRHPGALQQLAARLARALRACR
jgi:UDP-N-acetylmuramyl pentapeptide synthase